MQQMLSVDKPDNCDTNDIYYMNPPNMRPSNLAHLISPILCEHQMRPSYANTQSRPSYANT